MTLIYEEPKYYSKSDVNEVILKGNKKQICDMLVGLTFNTDDYEYVFSILEKYSTSNNSDIVGVVFECLGHAARIYRKLPEKRVLDICVQFKNTTDGSIKFGMDSLP